MQQVDRDIKQLLRDHAVVLIIEDLKAFAKGEAR